jgi:hypothetical protein
MEKGKKNHRGTETTEPAVPHIFLSPNLSVITIRLAWTCSALGQKNKGQKNRLTATRGAEPRLSPAL